MEYELFFIVSHMTINFKQLNKNHTLKGSSKPKTKVGRKMSPNVGLEPTTLRLRVSCSTD